jgi:SNF2 family DNA or RNA helicase
LGVRQRKQNEFWLKNFERYFTWKYPHHNLVKAGLVGRFAAALGQLWRLETAATLPASDGPTGEYPLARARLEAPSDWTPANLKVLELAYEHAKRGEKVLVGSDLILTGKFVADELNKKGVRAVHITEEKSGKVGTKNPRKRSREIRAFADGDAQVLCAGVQAMKLGHNLDVASTVIVSGLPWSFMAFDQFVARVHRLTSKKPVSIYVVIPRRSLSEKKWQLLKDKGGASDLAFDGELFAQEEEAIDWSKVLRELVARGLSPDGDEVDESEVEATWRAVPALIGGRLPVGERPHMRQAQPSLLDLPDPSEYVQAALF